MAIERMEHVGIVVDDLAAAMSFFEELGMTPQGGSSSVEGDWVDRIVGVDGIRADVAFLETPDGGGRIELIKFNAPPTPDGSGAEPANLPGLRHLAFRVDDIEDTVARLQAHGAELVGEVADFGTVFRLCYLRGPAGMIVELAQAIGK